MQAPPTPGSPAAAGEAFQRLFERHSRRIHWQRVVHAGLTGSTWGLLAGAVLAAIAWTLRLDWGWRLLPAALAVAGAAAAGMHQHWRRWSDTDVGMFLDARLSANAKVVTAATERLSNPLLPHVQRQACELLREAPNQALSHRLWSRLHMAGLLGGACIALAVSVAPPVRTSAQTPTQRLSLSQLDGFEQVKNVGQLHAIDNQQAERLKRTAAAALELEQRAERGLAEREVLSEMSKLRDSLTAELGELGNAGNRAGLAAAVSALRRNPKTRAAAEALGDGDLVRFDREMKKLAQQAEQHDRDLAQQALRAAEQVARERGAKSLAQELDDQRRRLQRRELTAELLRELDETLRKPPHRDRDGNPEGSAGAPAALDSDQVDSLGEALEEALKQLTPQQRRQVAEKVQRGIEDGSYDFTPAQRNELGQMAEDLSSEAGRQRLAESLRELSEPSQGAQRQQGLRDALRGLGRAQRRLGGRPIPMPGPQPGQRLAGDPQQNSSGPNPGLGGGAGQHEGRTQPVEAEDLRSKSQPMVDFSKPLLEASQGRAPSQPGEVAKVRGVPGLRSVRAGELLGVERAPVPAEYREQVSRYFSPE